MKENFILERGLMGLCGKNGYDVLLRVGLRLWFNADLCNLKKYYGRDT